MDSEMAEEEDDENDVSFRLETEVTTQLIAEFISQTPCWENIEVGAICAFCNCILSSILTFLTNFVEEAQMFDGQQRSTSKFHLSHQKPGVFFVGVSNFDQDEDTEYARFLSRITNNTSSMQKITA